MTSNILENYYSNLDSLFFDDSTSLLVESFNYNIECISSEVYLMPVNEGVIQTIVGKIKGLIDKLINFIKKIFGKLKSSSQSSDAKPSNAAAQVNKEKETVKTVKMTLDEIEKDLKNPDLGDIKEKSNMNGVYTKDQVLDMLLNDKQYIDLKDKILEKKQKIKYYESKLDEVTKKLNIDGNSKMSYDSQSLKYLHDILHDDASITSFIDDKFAGYVIDKKPAIELIGDLYPDEVTDTCTNILANIFDSSNNKSVRDILKDLEDNFGIEYVFGSQSAEETRVSKLQYTLLYLYFNGAVDDKYKVIEIASKRKHLTNSMLFWYLIDDKKKYLSNQGKEINLNKDILIEWCDYVINQAPKKYDVLYKKLIDSQNKIKQRFTSNLNSFNNFTVNSDHGYKKIYQTVLVGWQMFFSDLGSLINYVATITQYEKQYACEIADTFLKELVLKWKTIEINTLNKTIDELNNQYQELKKKYKDMIGSPINESYFTIEIDRLVFN